jgi:hypothetical protein
MDEMDADEQRRPLVLLPPDSINGVGALKVSLKVPRATGRSGARARGSETGRAGLILVLR